MIDLKERPEVGWDVLLAIALAGLLAAAWIAFGPLNKTPESHISTPSSVQDIDLDTKKNESEAMVAQKQITDQTWNLDPEAFGSQILQTLTQLAAKDHIQLSGFRIRKTIAAAGLIEAPFSVVAEGSFTDVMAFVGHVEAPESKIALSQLNISSGTGADKVTATLALTGFLHKEAK